MQKALHNSKLSNILSYLFFFFLICLSGCQRMHTETSGGGEAKINPTYEDKYMNTDPNLPGDRDSKRVE
jgi:hypothetical protein